LVDSEKIGKISFARSGEVDQIDHILTDRSVPADFKNTIDEMNIKLTAV